MEPQDLGDEFAEFADEALNWAEKVNAPLYPETWSDIQREMASENYARYRKVRRRSHRATWRVWCNVRQKWYLPNATGYTSDKEEAGLFLPLEALAIYEEAARGWDARTNPFPILVTLVPAD